MQYATANYQVRGVALGQEGRKQTVNVTRGGRDERVKEGIMYAVR